MVYGKAWFFMRKTWKKLLAYTLAGAMAVTSLTGIHPAAKAQAAETGSGVKAESTSDITVPDAPAAFKDLTADELIADMGTGWNLGNTMDGHSGYAVGETAWQKNITTKSLIKAVHDMGFNTIRIPVTWGNMINTDNSIKEEWMARVQDIVDYATAQNMYVIINIHHDGADNGEGNAHGWLDIDGTDEEFDAIVEKYAAVWKTIATRFKNYDEHLILESLNELFETGFGWSNNKDDVNRGLARINRLNQVFVDTVRATGSNNARRWLQIPTVNTQIKTVIESGYNFKMPTDTIEGRLTLAVHDYDGYGNESKNEGKSGGYAQQFSALKQKFVDKGIPVVIGEYGFKKNKIENSREHKMEGVAYLAKKYHLVACVWDDNGGYIVVNRDYEDQEDRSVAAIMRGTFYDTEDGQLPMVTPNAKLDDTFYYNDDKTKIYDSVWLRKLSSFDLSTDSVEVKAGDSVTVDVTKRTPEDSNDVVTWSSEDASIASVSNGKIVGRAVGTTKVIATAQRGGVQKEVTVKVTPQEVAAASTAINTTYDAYNLVKGEEAFIDATIAPAGNGAYLTYQTSDAAVADVSVNGRITALHTGNATITVSTSDGTVVKEIPVTVTMGTVDEAFEIKLAINILYNDTKEDATKEEYYGTETGSDVVKVKGDGTYTLKFDCAKDLSSAAKDKNVNSLNRLAALYIKDYDVTKKVSAKSPNVPGKIKYDSIKVDGKEVLDTAKENGTYNILKSGVVDTGNPFNVWDGSVALTGVTEDKTNTNYTFDGMDAPQVIEITFTLSDMKVSAGDDTKPTAVPTREPQQATGEYVEPQPTQEPTAVPTTVPTVAPSQVPTGNSTTAPAPVPSSDVSKGSTQTVGVNKYTVSDAKAKTLEYKATTKKNATSVSVPSTVKLIVNGTEVSYKVTSVAANACKNNKKLKSVTIGKNVKKIGANAFSGCKNLKKIKVQSAVLKSVGKNALKGVSSKCTIYVPKKQLKAYKKLFKGKGMKKVKIKAA